MMTEEEKRQYSRGYSKGSQGKWSEWKPPLPPDEFLKRILTTANALRDEVSGWLGSISTEIEGDSVLEGLQERLDDFDDVMEELSGWLRKIE